MHLIELSGDAAQMGTQHGTLLRKASRLPAPDPKMLRFAKECEKLMEQHAPHLLEELHALGKSAGWRFDALLTLSLTAPFDPRRVPEAACSVVAVLPERTADGRMIVGRNYDYYHDISKEGAATYRTYPQEGYASLGCSDIWVGRADGLNDAGLFVGIAALFLPWLQPGLAFWFIVRLALERCATVEEGVDLISSLPHAGSWTYLLADSSGRAAVLEPGPGGVSLRYPEDGLLVMTNHAVCPQLVGQEAYVPPDSRRRYRRLKELLGGEPNVDLEAVRTALRDHTGLVCAHGNPASERKFGTLWSLVGRPGDLQLEIAPGNPCLAGYKTISF